MESLTNEALNLVRELTASIKDVAPEVWAILVRQALIEGITLAGMVVVVAVFTAASIIATTKLQDTHIEDFFWTASVIGIVVLVLVTVLFVGEGLPRLLNPEYYAIVDLIPGK